MLTGLTIWKFLHWNILNGDARTLGIFIHVPPLYALHVYIHIGFLCDHCSLHHKNLNKVCIPKFTRDRFRKPNCIEPLAKMPDKTDKVTIDTSKVKYNSLD